MAPFLFVASEKINGDGKAANISRMNKILRLIMNKLRNYWEKKRMGDIETGKKKMK